MFLGGIANSNACVDENWSWITGEPFDLYLWHPEGNNYCGYELHLAFDDALERWNNVTNSSSCCCCRFGALFEWSADCNGDGIVDYGQILDGTFEDADDNGVPDCCDAGTPCVDGPVQWRVEDGGNGHWYAFEGLSRTWTESRAYAVAVGGDLATITSIEEQDFIAPLLPGPGGQSAFIGATDSESEGNWRWISGESWDFEYWTPGAPYGDGDFLECGGGNSTNFPRWNDVPNNAGTRGLVIEWSADCNGDGIVDYGQILDGTFEDADDNGVPDCCDAGNPCSDGAVQWRVEDGGNGHWYQAESENIGWYSAKASCEDRGGHLITITSPMERGWILSVVPPRPCSTSGGHWYIGAYQEPRDAEPADFRWVTGEPFDYTAWSPSSPSNSPDFCSDGEDAVGMFGPSGACQISGYEGMWNDLPVCDNDWGPGFIIEWSADCNGDGIVDYGQILDGTFADTDGNGVPDLCEVCLGDITGNGVVDAADLGILLAVWNTDGKRHTPRPTSTATEP